MTQISWINARPKIDTVSSVDSEADSSSQTIVSSDVRNNGAADIQEVTITASTPQRLPASLMPVGSVTSESLPQVIYTVASDYAERLQCPIDYLVVAMLSAAGAVVGNRVGIFPYSQDETWQVFPALWGGIVGDPGSKKSPAIQAAHKPLHRLEELAAQEYEAAVIEHKKADTDYKLQLEDWKKGKSKSEPKPPKSPKRKRLIVNDSTYQKLGEILAENPRGILAIGDELSGLLSQLDTPGQEAARGFYLSGWSGTQSYSFDRIGRGLVMIPRVCLGVFGGFQPDKIKGYVLASQRGKSTNDGMLQRFQLIVWPDPLETIKIVDRPPNHAALEQYNRIILRLNGDIRELGLGGKTIPNGSLMLHFEPDAQVCFNEWYESNESLIAHGTPDPARQSHFSKYRSLVPALALLFHLIEQHQSSVCKECVLKAIRFTQFLKTHADRIYSSAIGHDHASTRLLAERILNGQLADGFTCRSVELKGWSGLGSKERAQAAIDALVEYGWLFPVETRAGRPTIRYYSSPDISWDLL